uniref:Glutathione S-transferase kappa n=1 Tax=Hanusia phi TaxID=3032 RepID=A0A7S0I430_9CRYP
MAAAAKRMGYYFDVVSPYSAFSWKVVERFRGKWPVDTVLKPVFLGGVMKGASNTPPALVSKSKGVWMRQDIRRCGETFGYPILDMPKNFFTEVARATVDCQRLIVAAQLLGRKEEEVRGLITVLTDGIHADKGLRTEENNLTIDSAFIETCAKKVLPADAVQQVIAASKSQEAKDQLKANTEEAVSKGIFGSPSFVFYNADPSKEILIFGSDRFDQIAHVLGVEWKGPKMP